jgi:uncharacterized membrane protein YhaH (DUF805 family)
MKKYKDFTGRASRKEFWMFVLFNFLISFALGLVVGFAMGVDAMRIAQNLYTVIILVPGIAVGIRRMHDIGRSGWWILLPIINFVFYCLKGQPHDNEYGAIPI